MRVTETSPCPSQGETCPCLLHPRITKTSPTPGVGVCTALSRLFLSTLTGPTWSVGHLTACQGVRVKEGSPDQCGVARGTRCTRKGNREERGRPVEEGHTGGEESRGRRKRGTGPKENSTRTGREKRIEKRVKSKDKGKFRRSKGKVRHKPLSRSLCPRLTHRPVDPDSRSTSVRGRCRVDDTPTTVPTGRTLPLVVETVLPETLFRCVLLGYVYERFMIHVVHVSGTSCENLDSPPVPRTGVHQLVPSLYSGSRESSFVFPCLFGGEGP